MRELTLPLPDKSDPARDAVVQAWGAARGKAERMGRFWELPAYDTEFVRLYGNDTFCLVLA